MKPAGQHGRSDDVAAALTRLLEPASWIPAAYSKWGPLMEGLLREFLVRFDHETLDRLLIHQQTMPATTPPAFRAAKMAAELTALHKVCQILARHPAIPLEARAALAPLESLPPSEIPDAALAAAVELAASARPDLRPDPMAPKVGRGSVANVFRFLGRDEETAVVALKAVRPEALERVRFEVLVLLDMADGAGALEWIAGSAFSRTLAEALRDAARALLREIDFAGETAHLEEARAYFAGHSRVCIPRPQGPALETGVFMEFTRGEPVMEASMDGIGRRDVAVLLFRSLLLDPLFSGLDRTIFHADPHAGNILVRPHKSGGHEIVLLDWSQAGHLTRKRREALVGLCLSCALGRNPSPELLGDLLESVPAGIELPLPTEARDPLHAAFGVLEDLAGEGHAVPQDLLLLRKSFLTLEGVAETLDPGFDAWREARGYMGLVLASEMPMRALSLMLPWWDRSEWLRSGLATWQAMGSLFPVPKNVCADAKKVS